MEKALMLASVASMIEQFNMDNIKLLQQLGYEVHVVCNFQQGSTISDGKIEQLKNKLIENKIVIHQIPIPRKITNIQQIICAYKILKKLVEQEQYHIVHCHAPIAGVITRLACKNIRKGGTKVIYTAHGFHFYKGAPFVNWLLFYPIERYCAHYTDCLITINREDYLRAKRFHFQNKGRTVYVPGVGVDVMKIQKEPVDKVKMKEHFGISKDDRVILSVGELNINKNHEVVIRALAELQDTKLHYMICGQGELEDYLLKLCLQLGIEKQVIFTGFREDIIQIMKMADLFVFPSKREGLSLALMEAMAAGIPIICYNARGNGDLIADSKGGLLLKSNNVMSFSRGIRMLLQDEKLCRSMVEYNKEVIKKYDIGKISNKMRKLYWGIEASKK